MDPSLTHHVIESIPMSATMMRAISLSFFALLVSSSMAYAQRGGEQGVTLYHIDPQASDVRLLVFRDGVLSTFGHNHVVSLKEFTGTIRLQPKLAQSSFDLDIPVDRLVVDDAEVRRQEGENFASQPSESDIAGTRTNMLSTALLTALRFPSLKVSGTSGPVDGNNSAVLNLSVQIAGQDIKLSIPGTLKVDGDQLEVSGAIALTHKQLGLKPFTALLGSLRVAEQMQFKYRIRASKVMK